MTKETGLTLEEQRALDEVNARLGIRTSNQRLSLVERLRREYARTGAYAPEATCRHGDHPYDCRQGCAPPTFEAADEIERLRRELERREEALQEANRVHGAEYDELADERDRLRAALYGLLCEMSLEYDGNRKYDVYQVSKGAVADARKSLGPAVETPARRHDCPHCVCVVEEVIGREQADVNALIAAPPVETSDRLGECWESGVGGLCRLPAGHSGPHCFS